MMRENPVQRAVGLGLFVLVLLGCQTTVPAPDSISPNGTPIAPRATSTIPPITATPGESTPSVSQAPSHSREYLRMLSETIGPRVAGSSNEEKAAEYIRSVLEQAGYAPSIQPFAFVNKTGATLRSANVVAAKAGLSTREIIVGAHYDSVSAGRGADDNASGVAVLLDMAANLKDAETPYTIKFVAFGAEETHLQGSTHYVSQMTDSEASNTVVMINLDSLVAGDIAYVYGDAGERGVLRDWLLELAKRENLDLQTQPGINPSFPAGTTCDCSDHVPFKERGIPHAYLESTNWNLGELDGYTQVDAKLGMEGEIWHTEYDDLQYIDKTFPGRVNRHLNLFFLLLHDALTQFKSLE